MIQAIETKYRGCRFRSRLEARWAVFFDSLGLEWQYEKEGFNINGENYLPDFYFPLFEIYAEVKSERFDEREYFLIGAIGGMVLDGLPECRFYVIARADDTCDNCNPPESELKNPGICYKCYLTGGNSFWGIDLAWSRYKGRLWYSFGGPDETPNEFEYQQALEDARAACFEYGEHGI